jgi:hypothetical protein
MGGFVQFYHTYKRVIANIKMKTMKKSMIPILFYSIFRMEKITASICLAFFFISINAFSNIILVPGTYSTITAALNAAISGDTILVSPGIYYENIIWPNVPGIKLISTGDSSNTFIDANHIGRSLTFDGQLVLDTTTIVKGFTIRNGKITSSCLGGGIYLKNASVQLLNLNVCRNILINNSGDSTYGGGIFCLNSNPLIINTQICNNSINGSNAYGGGIACINSSPVINYSSISFNKLYHSEWSYGGGVFLQKKSSPIITNSEINNNYMGDSATWYIGGGLYSESGSNPILNYVTIRCNGMGKNGLWYNGTGAYIQVSNHIVLENVVIDSNYCANGQGGNIYGTYSYGGGIYFDSFFGDTNNIETKVIMTNVKIINNILGDSYDRNFGGGIYIRKCDTIIGTNLLIANNKLGSGTNNIFFGGAGISLDDTCNLILINSTIADNRRSDNGPIEYGAGLWVPGVGINKVSITNCIFWDLNSKTEIDAFSNLIAKYSDIRGGYSGTSNLNSFPIFMGNGNYHLQNNSPCIGVGTLVGAPLFDIDNSPRPMPVGTKPDLGAYEDSISYAGIDNFVNLNPFEINPNPALDKIIIEFSRNQNTLFAIYDIEGKLVLQGKLCNGTNEININALANGVYIVGVLGTDWTGYKKMIKY